MIVIWVAEAVRRWSDANAVAQAFEPPPTHAQRAFAVIEAFIDHCGTDSPLLSLIATKPVEWWERQPTENKFFFGVIAIFAIGTAGICWSGESFKFSSHGVLAAMICGLVLIYIAAIALNFMCIAVIVILLLLSLPLYLWRAAEVVTGFVARHLVPFGLRFRYRSWQLRRMGRRQQHSWLHEVSQSSTRHSDSRL